jgi:hypothetical protein
MPGSFSSFDKLKNHTVFLLEIYSSVAGMFQKPGYVELQEMTVELKKLGASYVPERDRPESDTHKDELLGALFFRYYNRAERETAAHFKQRIFVTDALGINELHQPDPYSVVSCYKAYYYYLVNTYIPNPRSTKQSEVDPELWEILSSLKDFITTNNTQFQTISSQLEFLAFLQSVKEMLTYSEAETNDFITALTPLIEEQVYTNGTLDYFDMLACVKQVKGSKLVHHLMEEHFLPDNARLNNWQYRIREQLDLCSELALVGAYDLALEQAKKQSNTGALQDTLGRILYDIQYNETFEKRTALDMFSTFVYMSDKMDLYTNPWGTEASFKSALSKQCKDIGAGIHNSRYKLMARAEVNKLYDFVHAIVYSRNIAVPPFAAYTSDYIGANKFHAMIRSLRTCDEPLVRLIEGLLIEGRIPVISDLTDELDKYWEQRTHDAVSLYGQAARDKFLRPMVDYLLWEIKNEIDFSSVRKRLARFDLSPSERYFQSNPFAEKQAHTLPPIKSILFFKPQPLPVTVELLPVADESAPACSSSNHP